MKLQCPSQYVLLLKMCAQNLSLLQLQFTRLGSPMATAAVRMCSCVRAQKLGLLHLGSGQPCVNDASLHSLSSLSALTHLVLGRLQEGAGQVTEEGAWHGGAYPHTCSWQPACA